MWEELLNKIPMYAIGIYAALIAVEVGLNVVYKHKLYRLKDTLCSLSMGSAYLTMRVVMKGFTLMLMYLAHEYALFDIGNSWVAFIACYVAMDFAVYWYHRFVHEVRFGWAAHIAHHSSEQYNLGATAFRQSFAEPVIEPFFFAMVPLLGFDPLMALVALELNLIYMFWVHFEKVGKLHPIFEWLFSTPSHHRVHHSANTPYLDKNYGGTFIIWDRLFGSFAEEKEAPVFGLVTQLNSNNPIKASFHEWINLAHDMWSARGIRNKIGYLVLPPGWAPDNQGMTTRQKQAIYNQQQRDNQPCHPKSP